MKNSKKLKLILMILICVLISLLGFLGIYSNENGVYKNILPKYELASDLKGSTVLEFEVDDTTKTIYLDKDGNEVDSTKVTEKNKKDYKEEKKPVNPEENLNSENYKEVLRIMKERLEFLKTAQYRMDLDEKTGKIVLTFEDEYPEDIKSILLMEGKLELIDSKTEEVILNYNDFKSGESSYATKEDGSYVIYFNLNLTDSGLEKINNIDKYKTVVETEEDSKENKEDDKETKDNKFKIMFDSDQIAEVSYDQILLLGKKIRITLGEDLTDSSQINSQLNTNAIVIKMATVGKLPVTYNIEAEEYVKSEAANYVEYITAGLAGICLAISIYFIIKYKLKGLLATISFAANIALFLIIIRLTNIQISLNGFAGMLGLAILNAILINNILRFAIENDKTFSEKIKKAYLKTIDAFAIILIIFVVFSFSRMTVINSMGLLVFWGWIVTVIGNLILTVPMLSIVDKK